ncbi:MAG: hypothetical protein KME29_14735 [Calothrix sp. FI2-JRJ7]|jgi:hypothetical protein|nr:hypothetical protein [Calothrix sp. FI2-JRJ7]
MEIKINKLYPCPCCGYLTLESQPPGTNLFCPICFWVDEAENSNWIGNRFLSLRQAQLNFIEFGACDQEWLSYVRRLSTADIRDSNWQPVEQILENKRLQLIERINQAFNDVSLEDGLSLYGARALDDWCSMEEAREISQKMTFEQKWQDIPKEFLEELGGFFNFIDPKGFRYYLPAFLIYSLNYNSGYVFTDFVYSTLKYKPKHYQKHLALLNQEQLEVAQEYINLIDSYA